MGDRLRKARETAGISQIQMAAETGISRRSLVSYENDRKVPRSALVLYSIRTGVPLEWIETGCTPRDLNPEPTDFGPARVLHLPMRLELAA